MSIWTAIYNNLKSNSFKVYSPGEKSGECKANYTVILQQSTAKLDGSTASTTYYDIMCYSKTSSGVIDYAETVKDVMGKLYPTIQATQSQSSPVWDESVKAYVISIEYTNYRKNKSYL